ncbi:ATP-dependent dethiobiotin synthetase BioD [Methylocella tundrae]|uniref:ATP-dependent dethiobiotin synthetase BioD n=1 Tax=Methylocella tundrae TaxID=227605 RepID=A0A8B6MA06_METTU|nr:dethiobiotin synthase [Methylocella tundrae]VTZ51770.1 ATP-dependent dethiobiotin synthetase BioD [Methylocella tundrae]
MPAFFITGSGTDVGKTFVVAGLTRAFREQGRDVEVLKPIVSGFNPADPSTSDPAMLLEALGRPVSSENLALVSPLRFSAPLSPDMAAAAEGRAIDMAEVKAFCDEALARTTDVLLIEGVGGVMVPLNAAKTQLDLMRALNLPLIFVGGSYLGAISHSLTALDVLRANRLTVRAVVISETPDSSVGLDATLATLANFTSAPLLALARNASTASNEAVFARLASLI